jgi:thiol-disulfide isomerase/thioredoxin
LFVRVVVVSATAGEARLFIKLRAESLLRSLFVVFVLVEVLGAPAHCDVIGPPAARVASEAQMKASLREIELIDDKGAVFDLPAALKSGKPTLVTLWANWCPNCRAEMRGFKILAEKCPDRWNVVFVSSRTADYEKDLARFRSFGLPWSLYRTSARMQKAERRDLLNAFSGATRQGEVFTPLHYIVSDKGDVVQIVNGGVDFSDTRRIAFCEK